MPCCHPEYDFAARDIPAPCAAPVYASPGYGYRSSSSILPSRRLFAYTLLHRFALLPEWIPLLGNPPPADVAELQEALWGL
jgi:hypothetical protein